MRAPQVLAFAAISLTVTMAFPMSIYPCRYTLEVMLYGADEADKDGGWRSVFISVLISGGALVLGMFVKHINQVFQLMGGTTSAFVCFVLPAVFALKLDWANQPSKEGGLSPALRTAMVWSLLLGGAGIGIVSTVVTVISSTCPPLHERRSSAAPAPLQHRSSTAARRSPPQPATC